METAGFLVREREVIVREAEETLMHLRERHYESAGAAEVERRLGALFDHLVAAVTTRDLGPVVGTRRRSRMNGSRPATTSHRCRPGSTPSRRRPGAVFSPASSRHSSPKRSAS